MTKFKTKENTFTITANNNGTFTIKCKNPNCNALNYTQGTVQDIANHLKKLLTSTLISMNENECKTITFTLKAN